MNIGITNSMVTPVYLSGSVAEGMQVVFDLRENYNIFCSIVVYPVIPKGQLLLRLIPTSMHTLEDVKSGIKDSDLFPLFFNPCFYTSVIPPPQ